MKKEGGTLTAIGWIRSLSLLCGKVDKMWQRQNSGDGGRQGEEGGRETDKQGKRKEGEEYGVERRDDV